MFTQLTALLGLAPKIQSADIPLRKGERPDFTAIFEQLSDRSPDGRAGSTVETFVKDAVDDETDVVVKEPEAPGGLDLVDDADLPVVDEETFGETLPSDPPEPVIVDDPEPDVPDSVVPGPVEIEQETTDRKKTVSTAMVFNADGLPRQSTFAAPEVERTSSRRVSGPGMKSEEMPSATPKTFVDIPMVVDRAEQRSRLDSASSAAKADLRFATVQLAGENQRSNADVLNTVERGIAAQASGQTGVVMGVGAAHAPASRLAEGSIPAAAASGVSAGTNTSDGLSGRVGEGRNTAFAAQAFAEKAASRSGQVERPAAPSDPQADDTSRSAQSAVPKTGSADQLPADDLKIATAAVNSASPRGAISKSSTPVPGAPIDKAVPSVAPRASDTGSAMKSGTNAPDIAGIENSVLNQGTARATEVSNDSDANRAPVNRVRIASTDSVLMRQALAARIGEKRADPVGSQSSLIAGRSPMSVTVTSTGRGGFTVPEDQINGSSVPTTDASKQPEAPTGYSAAMASAVRRTGSETGASDVATVNRPVPGQAVHSDGAVAPGTSNRPADYRIADQSAPQGGFPDKLGLKTDISWNAATPRNGSEMTAQRDSSLVETDKSPRIFAARKMPLDIEPLAATNASARSIDQGQQLGGETLLPVGGTGGRALPIGDSIQILEPDSRPSGRFLPESTASVVNPTVTTTRTRDAVPGFSGDLAGGQDVEDLSRMTVAEPHRPERVAGAALNPMRNEPAVTSLVGVLQPPAQPSPRALRLDREGDPDIQVQTQTSQKTEIQARQTVQAPNAAASPTSLPIPAAGRVSPVDGSVVGKAEEDEADLLASSGPDAPRTTFAQSAGSASGSAHGRDTAGAVLRQIMERVPKLADGALEVRLSPEELGRVRMHMTPSDHGMTVHIQADRPETLDLLRRHVDQLARDLADAGFETSNFTFGGGESDSRPGGGQPSEPSMPTISQSAPNGADANVSITHSLTASMDGLDIRI
ncbi:flagellar hook-length control protein FliK [Tropicibacter sp. S64]|uniref:flagellar hook-length control protein FliK n=1 Tax=Tropicibacter sp. S64 TaxID=3415122 RepID=UPI003C7CD514